MCACGVALIVNVFAPVTKFVRSLLPVYSTRNLSLFLSLSLSLSLSPLHHPTSSLLNIHEHVMNTSILFDAYVQHIAEQIEMDSYMHTEYTHSASYTYLIMHSTF